MTISRSGLAAPHVTAWALCAVVGLAFLTAIFSVPAPSLTPLTEYVFAVGAFVAGLCAYRSSKRALAAIFAIAGVAWLAYFRTATEYLSNLGADSFSEATYFDLGEAAFFLETISEVVRPRLKFQRLLVALALAGGTTVLLDQLARRLGWTHRIASATTMWVAAIGMLGAVSVIAISSRDIYESNASQFAGIKANFEHRPQKLVSDGKPIDVIVYMGESITAMNMQLYGYPRPTSPLLAKLAHEDPKLIAFPGMLSTHTHTSPSLLEAMSLPVNNQDDYLPINKRKRISLPFVLSANGIQTILITNQGMSGTWSFASRIIFQDAEQHASVDARYAGNKESKLSRPFDDDYFSAKLAQILPLQSDRKRLVFLHAYAGHGPYLQFIPEDFRGPPDKWFAGWNSKAIFGKAKGELRDVENYDAAVRYVDHSVANIVRMASATHKPSIVVFTSDHGESVFTRRGHDSSRFVHEMMRVPFVLYFNEAAKNTYPDLFAAYQTLRESPHLSSHAQLAATLLDLLGLKTGGEWSTPVPPVIGRKTALPPLLVRKTAQGTSYLNLNAAAPSIQDNTGKLMRNSSDSASNQRAAQAAASTQTAFCYHRSNSFAKFLRGSIAGSCVEIDVVVEQDGAIAIYHPPAPDLGLRLEHLAPIANARNLALWVDAKNIDDRDRCLALVAALETHVRTSAGVLMEFPSKSHLKIDQLKDCAARARKLKIATSFYVPSGDAIACAQHVREKGETAGQPKCESIGRILGKVLENGLFSDISFSIEALPAIERMPAAKSFRWNLWGIEPEDFDAQRHSGVGFAIFNNTDPNTN